MGLPQVNILFETLAASTIQRGERGIVALLLKDTTALGTYEIFSAIDIPTGLSAANKIQIELSLMGGVNAPLKVIVRVGDSATELDWTVGMDWLETVKFDYLAIPDVLPTDLTGIYSWLGEQRTNGKKVKAVLPDASADKEYVINFTTDSIEVAGVTYTNAQYCSRVAGLIAGTPLNISTTFQPLSEVDSVQSYTKAQLDTAVNNGEFVIFHDGEKVKVARGVNSFKTTNADKGASFKKIKIVDILDVIHTDIAKTIADNYIGKYPNSYDNKALILTAIQAYYKQLEADQLLDTDVNTIGIDIDAQRNYLSGLGVDVSKITDDQIKVANTGDQVFLKSSIKVLDAMEDISISVQL
ncbi:phage tail sheath subtilisin-like domain-containing protein [Fictibacillus nanhaiensis]|uniref:phage tail sheath subtilisin-like domain-containing protein n=1 Tax=Fictibacillus nanhaiensis TaxID=742169 RepID=UPI00203AE789|nr:phage tail sheath subtilisin-like domain-containing protein [Fictibacillus nanhaiensis]MCM3730070.1 phage tail sheath subtilisin-like domain-containing protein [Fictibacillus nanhaiensis]